MPKVLGILGAVTASLLVLAVCLGFSDAAWVSSFGAGGGVGRSHGTWGITAMVVALAGHVVALCHLAASVIWVHQNTYPHRMPLTWEMESRREALWCVPPMLLSSVLIVATWVSGDILAEKTNPSVNYSTASSVHIISSLLATGVYIVALLRYYRATSEIKKIMGIVRQELNRTRNSR